MILIQVVPKPGVDAYRILRDKVTREARTWSWGNKSKTKLQHKNLKGGYIAVGAAHGVVVASVRPSKPADIFFLVEKLVGRLVAWFPNDIAAINLQFGEEPPGKRHRMGK